MAYGFVSNGRNIIFCKAHMTEQDIRYFLSHELSLTARRGDDVPDGLLWLSTYCTTRFTAFNLPPVELGDYRLQDMLDHGLTSTVYIGIDSKGHHAALKLAKTSNDARLLDHEIDCLERVHGEISKIADRAVRQAFGSCLPRMERIAQGAAASRPLGLARLGSSHELRLTKNGFMCILRALCAIHHAGFVHRDLRPPNMIVMPGAGFRPDPDKVMLIDLGFACAIGRETETYCASKIAHWDAMRGSYVPQPGHDLVSLVRSMVYYATLSGAREDTSMEGESPGSWWDNFEKCHSDLRELELLADKVASVAGKIELDDAAKRATTSDLQSRLKAADRMLEQSAAGPARPVGLLGRWAWYEAFGEVLYRAFASGDLKHRRNWYDTKEEAPKKAKVSNEVGWARGSNGEKHRTEAKRLATRSRTTRMSNKLGRMPKRLVGCVCSVT